tara:strand:+ start:4334 stop:4846 length:513 start_codon:yes stop_codon:yes gene_type:complete
MNPFEALVKNITQTTADTVNNDAWFPSEIEIALHPATFSEAGVQVAKNIDIIVGHIVDNYELLGLQNAELLTIYTDLDIVEIQTPSGHVNEMTFEAIFQAITDNLVQSHEGPMPDYFPYSRLMTFLREHKTAVELMRNQFKNAEQDHSSSADEQTMVSDEESSDSNDDGD